jgi:putative protease
MQTKPLELLSPARTAECGIAAVNHGADAVYIGAPKFSARSAANSDCAEIEKLIAYAHRYYAKVYIALNTVLYDNELDEARQLISRLSDAGADALIIQDMGILEMDLPPIPLFASTQTNNVTVEKIQFLERVGFSRVILARELSLEAIAGIAKSTAIELESFVHGALCVSYSGQCYMSEFTTGRSANRGECSQACRLPYTLEDKKGNAVAPASYLLSLKDLNLSDHVQALADAGITSFKIEGRLKDISYVKNVTAHYRKILDGIIAAQANRFCHASGGETALQFTPDPARSFNRGFTRYFIGGGEQNLSSGNSPKSLGAPLGMVRQVAGNSFVLDARETIVPGDGLCFFNDDNELQGFAVNRAEGNLLFSDDLKGLAAGAMVFRNIDQAFQRLLSRDVARRTIPVRIAVICSGNSVRVEAVDADGNSAAATREGQFPEAENREKLTASLEKQLMKSGATIFSVTSVHLTMHAFPFLPVSVMNELRRDVLAWLEEERLKHYPRQRRQLSPTDVSYGKARADYRDNITNKLAEQFYRRHGVTETAAGFELQAHQPGDLLMHTKYCIRHEMNLCPLANREQATPAGALYITNGRRRFRLEFDCARCEMKIFST